MTHDFGSQKSSGITNEFRVPDGSQEWRCVSFLKQCANIDISARLAYRSRYGMILRQPISDRHPILVI